MRLCNPQLVDDLGSARPIRLDIGAGAVRQPDRYSLDIHELPDTDIVAGTIDVRVPHWANPLGHSDPTHVRLFGLYSFCYLVPLDAQPLGRKVPTYRGSHLFRIAALELSFRRSDNRLFGALESWLNADPRRMEAYEKNLSRLVSPYEIRCVLTKP